ncbi:arginine deiminase-related protein [Pseudonocardia eucalypti]|uniref:Arginine deiminase-related protein n=1 Tax=Pseudonocardia eucalypti TaxID=648755 RepID=A0ABP9QDH2_9PSEU|nr:N-dimethylarginine dimethylaminohydrolase [Pseudonocardia eucalypti]
MTVTLEAPNTAGERLARPHQYLMCPPEHFTVEYAINPWMDTDQPCDVSLALRQWQRLRDIYQELGHTVRIIEPLPQLPDMVFAANGGLVIGGRALAARFAYPQRADEGPAYLAWLRAAGFPAKQAVQVNEGEGDFLVVGGRVLAGTGFRTDPKAHAEVAEYFGLPVVSLELVNPRFYHLDTALAVLDDRTVAYYPEAFSAASRSVLRELYPDAVLAGAKDAMVFGLNAVSDGRNVVLAEKAVNLAEQLRERGFHPIGVDLSELLKAGGSAKCCTLEVRS